MNVNNFFKSPELSRSSSFTTSEASESDSSTNSFDLKELFTRSLSQDAESSSPSFEKVNPNNFSSEEETKAARRRQVEVSFNTLEKNIKEIFDNATQMCSDPSNPSFSWGLMEALDEMKEYLSYLSNSRHKFLKAGETRLGFLCTLRLFKEHEKEFIEDIQELYSKYDEAPLSPILTDEDGIITERFPGEIQEEIERMLHSVQERLKDLLNTKKDEARYDPSLLLTIDKIENSFPIALDELLEEIKKEIPDEGLTIEILTWILNGTMKFESEAEMSIKELTPEHLNSSDEAKEEPIISIEPNSLKNKILNLEETLSRQVVGQPKAIKAIYEAALCRLAGLSKPNQPMGRFLFVGPTGVGKTELAKTLSRELFGVNSVLTINMPEYKEDSGIVRLIGAPIGYKDHEDGGLLTNFVHKHPFSVILVDEAEKGAEDVMDLFLKVLDEGVLHDPQDRTIDFKNTVIVFTSNAGAAENRIDQAVKKYFRPEFLGRLDQVVAFNPLSKEMNDAIVDLELDKLNARAQHRGSQLEFSSTLREFLYEKSWDDRNGAGARGIQKMISDLILVPLAKQIIASEDSSKYNLNVVNGNLEIFC